MSLPLNQSIALRDRQNQDLGQVVIDRIQNDLVFGRFTPAPAYGVVEHLFAEYVEAANGQLLSIVGELDLMIRGLGLHLQAPAGAVFPGIYDVQIGAGIITFRVESQGDSGTPPSRLTAPRIASSLLGAELRSSDSPS